MKSLRFIAWVAVACAFALGALPIATAEILPPTFMVSPVNTEPEPMAIAVAVLVIIALEAVTAKTAARRSQIAAVDKRHREHRRSIDRTFAIIDPHIRA
jgi:hypothetical protein